jgi:phage-related protein
MSDARVCGNSEQARGLKDIMNQTMQQIESCIGAMERAANNIRSGWDDDGVGEVDEILNAIRTALNNAQEAMPSVASALDAYADFLDER